MLSPVSTWMGDRLGTLGAVGIRFFFFPIEIIFCNLFVYIIEIYLWQKTSLPMIFDNFKTSTLLSKIKSASIYDTEYFNI